jgi:hypothetical protein
MCDSPIVLMAAYSQLVQTNKHAPSRISCQAQMCLLLTCPDEAMPTDVVLHVYHFVF